ncbi:MAG TPA: hypothetical protein VMV94_18820, partial [Phycisphaerae bacterium]|nr:hypothetical protein [Phycisphaerae bacterium]
MARGSRSGKKNAKWNAKLFGPILVPLWTALARFRSGARGHLFRCPADARNGLLRRFFSGLGIQVGQNAQCV